MKNERDRKKQGEERINRIKIKERKQKKKKTKLTHEMTRIQVKCDLTTT
jgi:hypothetical protein